MSRELLLVLVLVIGSVHDCRAVTWEEFLVIEGITNETVIITARNEGLTEVNINTSFPLLRVLNLKINNIATFPTTLPELTPSLEKIILNRNDFADLDDAPSGELFNLTTLTMSGNKLSQYPDLTNFSSLINLTIANNRIAFISRERLDTTGPHLLNLTLTGNPLVSIEDTTTPRNVRKVQMDFVELPTFPHLPNFFKNIEMLYFQYNNFTFDYIDEYEDLYYMSLNHGAFGEVLPDMSNVSSSLIVLYLYNCGIRMIPEEYISGLTSLDVLGLNDNPLSIIPDISTSNNFMLQLSNVEITEFPVLPNAGPSITRIFFDNNNFTIRYIGHFDQILEISLQNCLFGGFFPDLHNVSTTLEVLELSNCGISSIEASYLNELVALIELTMSDNPIAVLPDVPGPGNTLQRIFLSKTVLDEFPDIPSLGRSLLDLYVDGDTQKFTEIPLARLQNLPRLRSLHLHTSPVRKMPDFTRFAINSTLTLIMNDTAIECDDNGKHLKLMSLQGVLVLKEDVYPMCDGNGVVKNVDLDAVPLREFARVTETPTKLWASSAKLTDPTNYYGYLRVSQVLTDTTRGSCSMACMLDSDCIMFAADGTTCALTGTQAGTRAEFLSYSDWYFLG